jgi:hypothetical protein
MKTRKRELTVVLLLLICAAFMFLGCPTPDGDPDDGDNGSGGGGDPPPPLQYEIKLSIPHPFGEVTVTPASHTAARGDTVTITLQPNSGYEPYGLLVYNASNYGIKVSPDFISNEYTYTFTMEASIVTVRVDFVPLLDAIEDWTEPLSSTSDWKEMDALNTLIKKAPDPTNGTVQAAIEKLAGRMRPLPIDPDPDNGHVYAIPGTALLLHRRYEPSPYTRGVVRTKIRSTDLKAWFPSTMRWPSDSMVRGVDLLLTNTAGDTLLSLLPGEAGPPSISDTLGTDMTILYYVKEDNPTIPPIVPVIGWQAGKPAPVTNSNWPPFFTGFVENLEEITEIPLVFEVGRDDFPFIYPVLLWPVAQYTLVLETGASTTGNVTLQEYEYDGDNLPAPVNNWTTRGTAKTLSANNQQVTGSVGLLNTNPAIPPAAPPVAPVGPVTGWNQGTREVMVEISTNKQNVVILVYSGSGILERDIYNNPINYIRAGTPGYFYPESGQYRIVVRPTTPPTGMP